MRVYLLYLAIFFSFVAVTAQENTWERIDSASLGTWYNPLIVYAPNVGKYLVTLGNPTAKAEPFRVAAFNKLTNMWENVASANSEKAGLAQFNNPYRQYCYNSSDGKIYFYVRNSTFTYDPVTRLWDTLIVNTHPNAHGMNSVQTYLKWSSLCYDAHNDEIVLFGGGGVDYPNGSPGTWTFKPSTSTWTKLSLDLEPSPRAHSPMVYDPINKKIIIFGGDHLDYLLNDTWVYDCITKKWSKRNPVVRPTARAGHAMVYLPQSGAIILMGGYKYTTDQRYEFEMWKYDLSADRWFILKRLTGSTVWPKVLNCRPGFVALAAAGNGDTVLAIGPVTASAYSFMPLTYRMVCNPAAIDTSASLLYGSAADTQMYHYDSETFNPSWYTDGLPAADTASSENFLRSLTPRKWEKITVPKQSYAVRTWSTRVIDTDRDQIVVWGGGHAAYSNTDVLQYSISENRHKIGYWPEVPLEYSSGSELASGPFTFNDRPFQPCHIVKSYAYDVNIKKVVYIGSAGYTYLYNTANFDWEKGVRIPHTPLIPTDYMANYGVGLCSTPIGVYALIGNKSHIFSADSLRWRALTQTGLPLPGFSGDDAGVVYDSKRNRIVYVWGSKNNNAKMYEYSFQSGVASQLFPLDSHKTSLPVNMWREMVYLPNQDIILFLVSNDSLSHVAYDCSANTWTNFNVSGYFAGMIERGSGLMYDEKRNLLWLANYRGEIWTMKPDSVSSVVSFRNEELKDGVIEMYPNPFNPATQISVTLNNNVNLNVTVHDLSGRLVREIVYGNFAKGKHSFIWNGTDKNGVKVSSGIYVFNVKDGNNVRSFKTLLSK